MNALLIGEPIAMWTNLNRGCISAQHRGHKVMHFQNVTLEIKNVTWACPPKGFAAATIQRHVFARMRGELVAMHGDDWRPSINSRRVSLNTKERGHLPYFHTLPNESPVYDTPMAWLSHTAGNRFPIAYGLGGDIDTINAC